MIRWWVCLDYHGRELYVFIYIARSLVLLSMILALLLCSGAHPD